MNLPQSPPRRACVVVVVVVVVVENGGTVASAASGPPFRTTLARPPSVRWPAVSTLLSLRAERFAERVANPFDHDDDDDHDHEVTMGFAPQ
jgi:hypothetical protein